MAIQATNPGKKKSRATMRAVEAGSLVLCVHCDEVLRFRTKQRDMQIICNVYELGVWERVDHFHPDCYQEAGSPFGACGDRAAPPAAEIDRRGQSKR